MTNKYKKYHLLHHLPLIGVLLAVALLQLFYLLENTPPMHWDPSGHITNSMRVARDIAASPMQGIFHAAVRDYVYYPPGYFITTAPAFWIFGYRLGAGISWQILYLLLTLFFISRLVTRHSSPSFGALTAFSYASFPVVLGLDRMCYIENLLTLQLVLFVYILLGDSELRNMKSALLLGLIAGWGQLTKWQFSSLIAPLALYLFFSKVHTLYTQKANKPQWLQLFKWVTLAGGTFSLIALPWYLAHFSQITRDVHYNAYISVMGNAPSYKLSSIFYYLQSLPWQLIGLPLSLIIYSAFIAIIARPKKYRTLFPVVISIVASIILMSFARHKQGRFIMPLLPLCITVTCIWISRQQQIIKRILVVLLLGFSLINAIAQTFDLSPYLPEKSLPIGFGRHGYLIRYGTPEWKLPPLSKQNWGLDDMFLQIRKISRQENIKPTVAWCLPNNSHPYYNAYTVYSYVYAYAKKVRHHKWANFWICHLPKEKCYPDGHIEALRKIHCIGKWNLPDGTQAQLYRCYRVEPMLKIPFTLQHTACDFYFLGFYDAETDFRWSCGKHSDMELPISEIDSNAEQFTVNIVLSGLGRQRVSIALNGKSKWSGMIDEHLTTISFNIQRSEIQTNATNSVQFDLPDARQPNKTDSRTLAIALKEFSIRPSEHP